MPGMLARAWCRNTQGFCNLELPHPGQDKLVFQLNHYRYYAELTKFANFDGEADRASGRRMAQIWGVFRPEWTMELECELVLQIECNPCHGHVVLQVGF